MKTWIVKFITSDGKDGETEVKAFTKKAARHLMKNRVMNIRSVEEKERETA